jgi:ribosomal peptide maturation radical SAM protein 1
MQDLPHTAFAGEWTFTTALYGENRHADARYVRHVLQETWRLERHDIDRIFAVRKLVPHFLNYCLETVPWQEYTLVGFTSTFEQNIASLALAKRIKMTHPDLAIVFGGGNWEDDMGRELHRRFPFVDYASTGEADETFPLLAKRLLEKPKKGNPFSTIPGIVYRSKKKSIYTGRAPLVNRMDAFPFPDYSDYFREFAASSAGNLVVPTLLFEGSRGCWWGAKSHCTFCGLNGCTLTFRTKSDQRILGEIKYLVKQWGIELIQAVDNVMDTNYFKKLLPELAELEPSLEIFYEVRASLTREQVKLLAQAGIKNIQPGIESLNDHVLKLMRKGSTALQNIQLLKWCREYGVKANWNILYGFPGEACQDYADTMNLLPSITFLDPPTACGPIRLDRFSPYFMDPSAYGLTNIRHMPVYDYIYPFSKKSVNKIAYYFDYDYETGKDPSGYATELINFVEDWQQRPNYGALQAIEKPNGTLALVDKRNNALGREFALTGADRIVYDYCDKVRSIRAVQRHLAQVYPSANFTGSQVKAFLDTLTAHRLMVGDRGRYLSLAVRTHPVTGPSNNP